MEADQVQACEHLKTGGAQDDYAKARELMRLLRNIEHSDTDSTDETLSNDQLASIESGLWAGALDIVEKYGEVVTKIANVIASRMKRGNLKAEIIDDELNRIPYVVALSKPK
jgi:hypothetical protein